MNRNLLTIGGLDPSGAAGILADLKTFLVWRVYGMAVITAITAQNTQSVDAVYPVALETIGAQLESVVNDIEIHAVKIGLLPDAKTAELIVELLKTFHVTNIVVDPVLRSTTGYQFADEKTIAVYREKLIPIADVVTPNMEEASVLSGIQVSDLSTMKQAAERIFQMGAKNVVVTGGHLPSRAVDVLYDGGKHTSFDAPKVSSTNTRGTGCTFASVLAIHLARKIKVASAIDPAKKYIVRALVHPFKIGKGERGPMNHNVAI
jgi:hydroxymethylpyrimidine/phosphomethylpyrimidine kinase